MWVVAPDGGDGGLGLCEPCTSDAQCGGAGDDCLRVGVEGDSFCFKACSGAAGDCPDGYVCSAQEVESVDGARARQCVPVGESCAVGGACVDDAREENDGRSQAAAIQKGTTGALRMCPAGDIQADEDWFRFSVTGDTQTTVKIAGDTYPNMELALVGEGGKRVAVSEDWGSDDDVERCLPAGTYYVRVYSYFSGENDYSLELDEQAGDCPDQGGGTCTDDPFEDDDDRTQARTPDFEAQVFRASDQQICAGDDDWFYVYLFGDEKIYGALAFDQASVAQDLDFRVYDGTGAMLVGCAESDPSACSATNGQSGDSNESLLFTAPAAGDYFVVVHGWNGSENAYGICLSLDTNQCGS
jgi:hypothetical protein